MQSVTSVQDYFDKLDKRFVSSASKGINAVIQYEIKGEGGGSWYVTLHDGGLKVVKDTDFSFKVKPTLQLKMDAESYVKMVNGDLDGRKAFMMRQLTVNGNMKLAQKMQKIFPPSKKVIETPKMDLHIRLDSSSKDRVVGYIGSMVQKDFNVLDRLVSPDLVTHSALKVVPKAFEYVTSRLMREQIFFKQLTQAFSGREFIVNYNEAINDNLVVINYTVRGVHNKGSYFGVPPSGEEEKIDVMAIFRLEKGKIIESWGGPTCCTCTGYVKPAQKMRKSSLAEELVKAPESELQTGLARNNVDRAFQYSKRMNEEDFTALEDFTSPVWFTHASPKYVLKAFEEVRTTREGEQIFFKNLTGAFSDRQFILNHNLMINDTDVLINYTILGVHDGGFFFDIAPSGQKERIDGTAILRFENEKIVEHWGGPSCPAGTGYLLLEG